MSKNQVLLMSLLVAVPALALLGILVWQGTENGGNMFSGLMTVVVALTGLLTLFGVAGTPVYVWAFYPAEGFVPAPPAPGDGQAKPQEAKPDPVSDDEEFGEDGGTDEFSAEGGFDDDEFQDDSFSDDSFDDGGFDDDAFDDDDLDEWE